MGKHDIHPDVQHVCYKAGASPEMVASSSTLNQYTGSLNHITHHIPHTTYPSVIYHGTLRCGITYRPLSRYWKAIQWAITHTETIHCSIQRCKAYQWGTRPHKRHHRAAVCATKRSRWCPPLCAPSPSRSQRAAKCYWRSTRSQPTIGPQHATHGSLHR